MQNFTVGGGHRDRAGGEVLASALSRGPGLGNGRLPWRVGGLVLALGLSALWLAPAADAEPTYPELTGRVVDDARPARPIPRRWRSPPTSRRWRTRAPTRSLSSPCRRCRAIPIEDFGYQLGRHWGIGTAKLRQWRDADRRAQRAQGPHRGRLRSRGHCSPTPCPRSSSTTPSCRSFRERQLRRRHQGRRARHHHGADRRCCRGRGTRQGPPRCRRARRSTG